VVEYAGGDEFREGLQKSFGGVKVLAGVDLTVARGGRYALLGPNGAGKTTTIRILSTLMRPDAGRAMVAGCDVVRDRHRLRRRISLTGQYAALDGLGTGEENLRLAGRLAGSAAGGRDGGPANYWSSSVWPGPRGARSRSIRVACGAGWTWPRAWSPSR
jgi:ABC-type branched-subunit amino acid transport system ATPase component